MVNQPTTVPADVAAALEALPAAAREAIYAFVRRLADAHARGKRA